jgi:hypothetical protein
MGCIVANDSHLHKWGYKPAADAGQGRPGTQPASVTVSARVRTRARDIAR